MAEWLDRVPDDREVALVRIPVSGASSKLGQVCFPTMPLSHQILIIVSNPFPSTWCLWGH